MPVFGKSSAARLAECHPDLRRLFSAAIADSPVDFAITCGHRGKEEQDRCCAEGKSKTPWPTSKHNALPSLALDVVPVLDGHATWDNREAFLTIWRHVRGHAERMDIAIRYGGDWDGDGRTRYDGDADERFVDLPHFELKG